VVSQWRDENGFGLVEEELAPARVPTGELQQGWRLWAQKK
jgi:hypothetical protein